MLPDSYILFTTPDAYAIQPADGHDAILIDRLTGDTKFVTNLNDLRGTKERTYIFGVAGVIQLLDGPHLVVIQNREKVGDIPIFRISKWLLLPFARSDAILTAEQKSMNEDFKNMVMQVLNTPSFYYSNVLNITHTLQRLHRTSASFTQLSLYASADERFVWNGNLLNEWAMDKSLHGFLIPVIHGFVSFTKVQLRNGKSFNWTIISRRSVQRAGTRFNMRGADTDGRVANFVETEMIIETEGARSSYVQTRGSIPLIWQQIPDLKYKPDFEIARGVHETIMRKHFDEQVALYGKQVMIDLIDQKGGEQNLGLKLGSCIAAIAHPQVRYEPFDFHKECKGMRYDRLQLLIDRVAVAQDAFGFFMEENNVAKSIQQGAFRTNCIDCLDRTNVVQSLLAKRSLQAQLVAHGAIVNTLDLDDDSQFENLFRNVWADNGDACSLQYTGTCALKSDFTRTGKRTVFGALCDGYKSLVRYYKNNFADGYRQDGIDLLLGNCRTSYSSEVPEHLPNDVFMAPLVLMVLLALFIFVVLFKTKDQSFLIMMIGWIVSTVFTVKNIILNRSQYVDRPRLKRHGSFRNLR